MRQISFISLLVISITTTLAGQDNVDHWQTLALVQTHTEYDEFTGMNKITADPLPPAMALNGQELEIRGYIIALDAKKSLSHIMFSRYPQNMCFFCGAAGPESAMQVFVEKGKKIDYTSDKVVIQGTLSIQKGDLSGLVYTLTNAKLIKVLK